MHHQWEGLPVATVTQGYIEDDGAITSEVVEFELDDILHSFFKLQEAMDICIRNRHVSCSALYGKIP